MAEVVSQPVIDKEVEIKHINVELLPPVKKPITILPRVTFSLTLLIDYITSLYTFVVNNALVLTLVVLAVAYAHLCLHTARQEAQLAHVHRLLEESLHVQTQVNERLGRLTEEVLVLQKQMKKQL